MMSRGCVLCVEKANRDMGLVKYTGEKTSGIEMRLNEHMLALSHIRMRLRT